MIATILFLLASVFYFIAGLGLLRLPDSLARLHAGTKASSLATALALMAAFTHTGGLWTGILCLFCMAFVFLTAPLASHAIARCVLADRLAATTPHPTPPSESPDHRESRPGAPS